PLASEDAIRSWRERENVFITYIDRATRQISTNAGAKVLPLGLDTRSGHLETHECIEPDVAPTSIAFEGTPSRVPKGDYLRRYVLCAERQPRSSYFSIGVRDPFESYTTPVWLRFHADTGGFSQIRTRLRSSSASPRIVESGGHVWIPIDLRLHADLPTVVALIVEEANRIRDVARGT
ncbi:MAG TPA: hypothetical protein VIV60_24490, partial [Polyangiaceae bacterium]